MRCLTYRAAAQRAVWPRTAARGLALVHDDYTLLLSILQNKLKRRAVQAAAKC
jgi:hypothetical protein